MLCTFVLTTFSNFCGKTQINHAQYSHNKFSVIHDSNPQQSSPSMLGVFLFTLHLLCSDYDLSTLLHSFPSMLAGVAP